MARIVAAAILDLHRLRADHDLDAAQVDPRRPVKSSSANDSRIISQRIGPSMLAESSHQCRALRRGRRSRPSLARYRAVAPSLSSSLVNSLAAPRACSITSRAPAASPALYSLLPIPARTDRLQYILLRLDGLDRTPVKQAGLVAIAQSQPFLGDQHEQLASHRIAPTS